MSFHYLFNRQNSDLKTAALNAANNKKESSAKKKLQVSSSSTLKRKISIDPTSHSGSDAVTHGSSTDASSDSGASSDEGEEDDMVALPEGPWPTNMNGAVGARIRMRSLKRISSVSSSTTGGATSAGPSIDNDDGDRRELHSFPHHSRSQQYMHAVRQLHGGSSMSFQQRHQLAVRCWQATSLFHVQDARTTNSHGHQSKRMTLPRSIPPAQTPFGTNPVATSLIMQEKAMADKQAAAATAAALKSKLSGNSAASNTSGGVATVPSSSRSTKVNAGVTVAPVYPTPPSSLPVGNSIPPHIMPLPPPPPGYTVERVAQLMKAGLWSRAHNCEISSVTGMPPPNPPYSQSNAMQPQMMQGKGAAVIPQPKQARVPKTDSQQKRDDKVGKLKAQQQQLIQPQSQLPTQSTIDMNNFASNYTIPAGVPLGGVGGISLPPVTMPTNSPMLPDGNGSITLTPGAMLPPMNVGSGSNMTVSDMTNIGSTSASMSNTALNSLLGSTGGGMVPPLNNNLAASMQLMSNMNMTKGGMVNPTGSGSGSGSGKGRPTNPSRAHKQSGSGGTLNPAAAFFAAAANPANAGAGLFDPMSLFALNMNMGAAAAAAAAAGMQLPGLEQQFAADLQKLLASAPASGGSSSTGAANSSESTSHAATNNSLANLLNASSPFAFNTAMLGGMPMGPANLPGLGLLGAPNPAYTAHYQAVIQALQNYPNFNLTSPTPPNPPNMQRMTSLPTNQTSSATGATGGSTTSSSANSILPLPLMNLGALQGYGGTVGNSSGGRNSSTSNSSGLSGLDAATAVQLAAINFALQQSQQQAQQQSGSMTPPQNYRG
jgi:hypothetical protein